MDNLEAIKANAELVIKTFPNENLAFDENSIAWLDGYIERNRQDWSAELSEKLSSILGSFLGECIIKNFGGAWEMTEYGLAVKFKDNNCVYPFNKIKKQFSNGSDDSILSFYQTIPILFHTS